MPSSTPIHKILFVCLGNICRSPAADGIMHSIVESHGESDLWEIDSAGTGRYHIGDLPDRRMRLHARQRGYELTHRARQVTEADFDRYDLIIGMDSANVADLRRLAPTPEAQAKVHAMAEYFSPAGHQGLSAGRSQGYGHSHYDHVPDPYYEGAEGFELVLDLLEDACTNLYTIVTKDK